MFEYENGILKIQQIPEKDLEPTFAQYQRASYKRFCDATVYEYLTEFIEQLADRVEQHITVLPPTIVESADKITKPYETLKERVMPGNFYKGPVYGSSFIKEHRTLPDRYTPIYADLDIDGAVHRAVEVFRLPDMDDDCILNVHGDRRICQLSMSPADGVSYDVDTLNISLPRNNLAIIRRKSGISVKLRGTYRPLLNIVYMMCYEEDFDEDIREWYLAADVRRSIYSSYNKDYGSIAASYTREHVYKSLSNSTSNIGSIARDSINNALKLDRAIGRKLSRDALNIKGAPIPGLSKGKVLTASDIALAKKNFCNALYVEALPDVEGYAYSPNIPMLTFKYIPQGTLLPKEISSRLPAPYKNLPSAPITMYFNGTNNTPEYRDDYVVFNGSLVPFIETKHMRITKEMLEFMKAVGMRSLKIRASATRSGDDDSEGKRASGSKIEFEALFEEEIIGNYTVKLSDVWSASQIRSAGNNRSADEWVNFYNNTELNPTPELNNRMSVYDWLGILNLASFIKRNPETHGINNKDTSMLKRVSGPNELFAKALSESIRTVFYKPGVVSKWTRVAQDPTLGELTVSELYDIWCRTIWNHHYIALCDMINPAIHTGQICNIYSALDVKEVRDEMRMLSTGYYGRIDPYETPSSKSLGVTNAVSVAAKIDLDTGVIYTPYCRVIREMSNGRVTRCYISDQYEYLSPVEETSKRIGDKLSFTYRPDGSIEKTDVVARVPDGQGGHTVETVSAWSLDYVNAHSLQSLALINSLVPFIGANESARLTLGSSMMKQSILVQYSEKPRVFTSMYRQMFNHSNTYCAKSPVDGLVVNVQKDCIVICPTNCLPDGIQFGQTFKREIEVRRLGNTPGLVSVHFKTGSITKQGVNIYNYKVTVGSWVKAGQVVYDSTVALDGYYSPGCNFLVAYIPDGYNYEDAIEISDSAASRMTSISLETKDYKLNHKASDLPNRKDHIGEFVQEKQDFIVYSGNISGRNITQAVSSDMHSGVLKDIIPDPKASPRENRYLALFIAFNKLRTGDKLIGRHSNKGTASIIQANSKMPRFLNGIPCDVVLNPMGVPSRLNIGQNYEAFLGFVAYLLDIYIENNAFNGATRGDIAMLMNYVYRLANDSDADKVNAEFPMLPVGLRARGKERHSVIREWEGCFNANGTAWLINPASGKRYETPVTFGMPYMLKLKHEVNGKLKVRAGLLDHEDYSMIYKQPTDGERVGEMEMIAYSAYGANHLLDESINEDSDNLIRRIYSEAEDLGIEGKIALQDGGYFDVNTSVPYSLEYLRYMLEVLGVSMDDPSWPDTSKEKAAQRRVPSLRQVMSPGTRTEDTTKSTETHEYDAMIQAMYDNLPKREV